MVLKNCAINIYNSVLAFYGFPKTKKRGQDPQLANNNPVEGGVAAPAWEWNAQTLLIKRRPVFCCFFNILYYLLWLVEALFLPYFLLQLGNGYFNEFGRQFSAKKKKKCLLLKRKEIQIRFWQRMDGHCLWHCLWMCADIFLLSDTFFRYYFQIDMS